MGGSVPFGYRLVGGQKVRDEAALAVVKEIFERSARGESTYTIAEFVRRAGYYRRDNTIPDILRNAAYIADDVVSAALAQRAVAALESRRSGKVRRVQSEDYSGMVWCVCGKRMHRHLAGGMPAKGVEPTRYYRCKEHFVERDENGKPKQPTPMVRADDTDVLVDIAMTANVMPWMIEIRTGGDTREADKAKVWKEMEKATKGRDMAQVMRLNAELDVIDARKPEPERIHWGPSGKTRGQRWDELTIPERRAWLYNEGIRLTVWNVKKWYNLPVPVSEDGRLWARGKVRLSETFVGEGIEDAFERDEHVNRGVNATRRLSDRLGTIGRMAYDESLARRIRDIIGPDPELTEKKMFGGLAFLVRGHMAISASGQGGVLVHADPARSGELITTTTATVAVMRGREMPGWLRVSAEDVTTDDELSLWVEIGIAYARSLPPKLCGSVPCRPRPARPRRAPRRSPRAGSGAAGGRPAPRPAARRPPPPS